MLKSVRWRHTGHHRRAGIIVIAAVALAQQTTVALAASGSWTIVLTPNLPASLASLGSVSCPTATSCFAVGDAFAHSKDRPLAEHWDGSAWSVMPTSGLSLVGALDSVSCVSVTSCTAVGGGSPGSAGLERTLVINWDGKSWSRISSPSPGQGGILAGVSCVATSNCFAVGVSISTSGAQGTLIEHWNGTRWSISPSPNPSGVLSTLDGVSCPTRSGCFAVGEYSPSQQTTRTLTERWNGSSWSIVASRNVSGSGVDKLYGVACTTMSACEAIGLEGTLTLAERWNGTSWSIVPSANASSGGSGLFGISCSSATSCLAVGTYALATGRDATLIEQWDGSAWALVDHPNPQPSLNAVLGGVDCRLATACIAVGSNDPTVPEQHALVEQRMG